MNVEKTAVSADDMALINQYSRAELSADDVYSFKMVCCDSKIDRDGEAFSVNALHEMAKLFVGKTVITDHKPSAKNQIARIYKTHVKENNGFSQLIAWAYIPKTDTNSDIITLSETGIVKEVSVGCSVRKRICSVCGEAFDACHHRKFKEYNGKTCYGILDEVTDAYEVSFVAVPAQRGAGVTKQCAMYNVQCADIELKIKMAENFIFCLNNFYDKGDF